jgi:hypothetical protein
MVSGLLIHTNATDSGMLALQKMAIAAASSICSGIGIMQQKSPIAQPLDTLVRVNPHNLVSCIIPFNQPSDWYWLNFFGSGLMRLKNLRGMV